MDQFQELLWDLGELIELPLHIDKNHACCILLDEKLMIHMEVTEEKDKLFIGAFVAELQPGRFRQNVLQESLKMNASYHPFGTLAYFEKTNQLLLQTYLPINHLNAQKLADFLEDFITEAESWQEAITNGQPAPANYLKTHGHNPSPYLIPPKTI